MIYNSLIPELTVSNIEKTKVFYIHQLGFTLEYEREEERFAFLSYNGCQMMFEQFHADGWNVGELTHPFGRGINFSIHAKNIGELYQSVLQHGITPYRKLQEVRYQCGEEEVIEIQFLIQDPDGYLLRFTNQ